MPTDTVSIEQFIETNRIAIRSEYADSNPNMPGDTPMDHWKVTLSMPAARVGRKQMTTYFSKGMGHKGAEPTAPEVLGSLALDASSADDHGFEDFCQEFGYSEDSRTAERIYKSCQHTAKRLRNFLGTDLYGELLYSTEY